MPANQPRVGWRYYEAHVTIEPVFDDRLEELARIASTCGFRVADLLMKKRKDATPVRSDCDTFCTSRHEDLAMIELRTSTVVRRLTAAGFIVWRYKIEDTIIDSRHDDVFCLISPAFTLAGAGEQAEADDLAFENRA